MAELIEVEQVDALIERLRRKWPITEMRRFGLVNIDGPEAADLIATMQAREAELVAEVARLREALEEAEDELMHYFLRSDSAERCKCTICGAEAFSPSGVEHRSGCFVARIATAIRSASDERG